MVGCAVVANHWLTIVIGYGAVGDGGDGVAAVAAVARHMGFVGAAVVEGADGVAPSQRASPPFHSHSLRQHPPSDVPRARLI